MQKKNLTPFGQPLLGGVFLWLIFLGVVLIFMAAGHDTRTVTPNYVTAAQSWLAGKNLYNQTGRGFIYLPQSAILYIPLAVLPFWLSEFLWRAISLGVLCYGFYLFSGMKFQIKSAVIFFFFTIIAIPLCFDSARNGQFNIIISALMLLACFNAYEEKWWWSAICLGLGFALKPVMIVLLLLLGALYFQLAWRLIVVMLLVFIFPFFLQSPNYVIHQYQDAWLNLRLVNQVGEQPYEWAQIFGMLAQMGIAKISPVMQMIIRILTAVLVFIGCFLIKKKFPKNKTMFWIYTFAASYLMLFNPRTENNDYILMAPTLAFFIAKSFQYKKYFDLGFILLITFGMAESYMLSKFFFPPYKSVFAPLMVVLLWIWISLLPSCGLSWSSRKAAEPMI